MVHKFYEHVGRSVVKAITFRLLVLFFDGAIIYVSTRRVDITLGVMGISTLLHTSLYFLHERMWNTLHWGKHKHE